MGCYTCTCTSKEEGSITKKRAMVINTCTNFAVLELSVIFMVVSMDNKRKNYFLQNFSVLPNHTTLRPLYGVPPHSREQLSHSSSTNLAITTALFTATLHEGQQHINCMFTCRATVTRYTRHMTYRATHTTQVEVT